MTRNAMLTAALALALTAAPALAQTAADASTIAGLAEQLETITETGDMPASLNFLPPTLLDSNARAAGLSRAEFDALMIARMEEAAEVSTVEESEIAINLIEWHKLPDGTLFATMPTRNRVVVDLGDGPVRIAETSTTLALKDQGEWRLVRAGSAEQQASLRAAFPWLEQVRLPAATVEVIKE